jgi:mannose-6-phosphate isomerase-like protein (cupin superfamily)
MPDGSVYVVTTPTAETGGEYVGMEFILPDRCAAPPPHVHPSQFEDYEVLEGRFEILIGDEWTTLGPGESGSVPAGVLHTFRNRSGATVRVKNRHSPAGRFEEFIEAMSRALAEAGVKGKADPRVPMILSQVFARYEDTLRPGRRREAIPMRAMAGLGRLLRLPG